MKLEDVQDQLLELSPLKLSQQFSRDDLIDLRDQLKAKRAGLIEAKDKCKNGNSIALMNIELSQVNSMITRINQTITLLDQDAKIMKKIITQRRSWRCASSKLLKVNWTRKLSTKLKQRQRWRDGYQKINPTYVGFILYPE